jgi:GWxTD domain-containing protein
MRTVVALLAGALVLPAAWADDLPPMRADSPPVFSADLAISLDAQGKPTLSTTITVPFREVQWVLIPPDGRRAAHIAVSVAFEGKRRDPIYGDLWERRVVVPSFGASRSPNSAITERKVFALPPGRYQARVVVHDLNGDLKSTATQTIEIPDYSRMPVGLSDLELGTVDSTGFTPTPTRRFGLEVDHLGIRVSLFDRRAGDWPRKYPLKYRILDEYGEEVVTGRQEVTVARSAEPIVIRPPRTDLFVGRYSAVIELAEAGSRWKVERSFEVEESGPPRGREFALMLEPLSYIASNEEIQALRALPPEEQARGWEEFWRKRDPTPDTPRNEALIEFIRRVRHAERAFQGFGPGWRSDMGRIYIKYGPPSQTESRPPSTTTPQLEIWFYTNPTREFVFADREGFGRYVLVSPLSE